MTKKRCEYRIKKRIVYGAVPHEFLKSSLKYVAVVKYSLAGTIGAAVLPTVMVRSLVAPKLIDAEQLKKDHISNIDVLVFLSGEIQRYTEAIQVEKDIIHKLQEQIEVVKAEVSELQN